jgi:hypothetical protein
MIGIVKECPFCLTPVSRTAEECPNCKNRLAVFRTGYYTRPDLSRSKTALIWVVVIVILLLLGAAFARSCAKRATRRGRPPMAASTLLVSCAG